MSKIILIDFKLIKLSKFQFKSTKDALKCNKNATKLTNQIKKINLLFYYFFGYFFELSQWTHRLPHTLLNHFRQSQDFVA